MEEKGRWDRIENRDGLELFMGKAYWPDTVTEEDRVLYHELSEDISTEVLVIGGGMSGSLAAYRAAEKYGTVLIDCNRIGMGSTSLNTGLIQYMSDDYMSHMAEKHGQGIADHFYRASIKALDSLEEISKEVDYEVDFVRNCSVIRSDRKSDIKMLEEEQEMEKGAGIMTELLEESDLKEMGLKGRSGMVTHQDVEFNPYRFVTGIIRHRVEKGNLKVFEMSCAEGLNLKDREVRVNGHTITYERLIIATGYNFLEEVRSFIPDARLIKTFAMVTTPMPMDTVNEKEYMVWDTEDPYFYFRKTRRGNVVIGGEDEKNLKFSEKELLEKTEKMRRKFKDIRGVELKNIPWRYAAIFGESDSGLPYMGRHPDHEEVFIIHGVGGNGTVYSAMASDYIHRFLEDNSLEEISYLAPGRKKR